MIILESLPLNPECGRPIWSDPGCYFSYFGFEKKFLSEKIRPGLRFFLRLNPSCDYQNHSLQYC